jgi:hypothetical protein
LVMVERSISGYVWLIGVVFLWSTCSTFFSIYIITSSSSYIPESRIHFESSLGNPG